MLLHENPSGYHMYLSTFLSAGLVLFAFFTSVLAQEPRVRVNLDDYVGQYQSDAKTTIVVRRTRERLTAQAVGQLQFELAPLSDTSFRWKTFSEVTITAQKDDQGKVIALLVEQNGRQIPYRKVSAELPADPDFTPTEAKLTSPRLAALAKAVKAGEAGVLDQFWLELHEKAPLVEPIPGDRHYFWVTFLWRGNVRTQRVAMRGGLTAEQDLKPLTRLGATDVWYRTERLPHDSRLAYGFFINRPDHVSDNVIAQLNALAKAPPQPDPRNPKEVSIQGMIGSLLELPGAPPQPWLERLPCVPAGRLTEYTIKSALLQQERSFTLYTPAGHHTKGDRYGLLILFDGPLYQSHDEVPGPIILDNLIAKKKLPPLVVLFVKQKFRNIELSCSESYANYVAKELVLWAREHAHAADTPHRTAVGGLSLGGLMASYCAWRHPEVFGQVLSQSGSYQWHPGMTGAATADSEPGGLTRRFVDSPRRSVRFHLEAGKFEHSLSDSLLTENQRFRDVLRAKGYAVRYLEFSGGHDFLSWRGNFADGLIYLFATPNEP
jgi:enterochelin esterase family protein